MPKKHRSVPRPDYPPGTVRWLVCDCQLWRGVRANLGKPCGACEAALRLPDDVDRQMYGAALDNDPEV